MPICKTLNFLEAFFFLILVILPAPLFGGRDTTTLFLVRALILGTSILFLISLIFYSNNFFFRSVINIRFVLLLFCIFILYGVIQWHGGQNVFSKIKPGSIDCFETKDHVIQFIFYLLFFLLCLHFFSSQRRIRVAVILIAVETAFLIALGYFQTNIFYGGLKEIYGWHHVPKQAVFFSSFFNKNHYGCFLLLASYLFMGSLIYGFRDFQLKRPSSPYYLENLLYVLLLPAVLVSMLQVRARAAFFMELCGVFLLWFFVFLIGGRKKALLACLVFGGSVYLLALTLNPSLLEPYQSWHRDFMLRFTMWKESIPLFLDFPYFGTGLGTFKWISRRYQMTMVEDFWVDHVHNDYLELITDAGVVGFLIFMAAIVWLLIFSLRQCLKSPSRWNRTVGCASFMAVVALGMITTIDFYLRTPAVAMLFIVHLGILVNCGSMYAGKQEDQPMKGGRITPIKTLLILIGITLLYFLGHYAYLSYQTGLTFDRYEEAQTFDDHDFQSKNLQSGDLIKSISVMPEDPRGWKLLGDLYFRKASFKEGRLLDKYLEKSIKAYKVLIKLAPTRPDAWLSLGKAEIMRGDWEDGFKNMRRGLDLSPYNRDIYLSIVIDYLHSAEILSVSKEQSETYIQQASFLIDKASSLKRPFTLEDFDYIGTAGGKLSQENRLRVQTLLRQIPTPNIHKSL